MMKTLQLNSPYEGLFKGRDKTPHTGRKGSGGASIMLSRQKFQER
jgi:hypothetical protein